MAYVLSLRPQSPLKRSFSETPYLRSCSPLADDPFIGTIRHLAPRNISATSLNSLNSIQPGSWLKGNENTPPGLTSRSLLDLVHELEAAAEIPQLSCHITHEICGEKDIPVLSVESSRRPSVLDLKNPGELQGIEVDDPCGLRNDLRNNTVADEGTRSTSIILDEFDAFEDAVEIPLPEDLSSDSTEEDNKHEQPLVVALNKSSPPPFKRWMSTLRKRNAHRQKVQSPRMERWSLDTLDNETTMKLSPLPNMSESTRRMSGSMSSSLGFVTAIKSASITLASVSIAPRSYRGGWPSKLRVENRSSGFSDARVSMESNTGSLGPIIDEGAWLRSVQRRKILEELIASEESYIGDMKVLVNDYFMLLSSVPSLSSQTQAAIQQNVTQILQLHEDLLGELHKTVPHAEYTQTAGQESYPITKAKHIRFHSADIIPGRLLEAKTSRKLRHSLEIGRPTNHRPIGLVADTRTAGNVAKIFNKYMKRFFAYEEYGAHWTTMSQDLTLTCKSMPTWQAYERGIEALSKSLASENNREASSRKALTFSDLLIKAICKYPLLFEDLCRQTPVYDDPESHAELEKALFRLQEAIRETISRAAVFRLLGHALLCGVLHVAYQSNDRVKGQYMICVLYKSCLVLATTNRVFTPYNVVAAIALANGTVEEPDNGRGLQCYTAQHTWKLVFESGHRLFEIILSACSQKEQEEWKKHLRDRIALETHDLTEGRSTIQDMFSFLSLDLKSIGPIFGQPQNPVRRMSVHRSATMGPKMSLHQVIIKNTQAQKSPEPGQSTISLPVARSQSHLSTNHIPTLAPRRAERIRLETALSEVWTKDILPFPGMATRRAENPIRASANSVMRKLSMASIASNFSKRSPSYTSLGHTRSEESIRSSRRSSQHGLKTGAAHVDRRPAPAVVDFHNAPAAFLPTDFELQERPSGRRRRVGNRAGLNERSSERSLKRSRRLSTIYIRPQPREMGQPRPRAREASNGSDTTVIHRAAPVTEKLVENNKLAKPMQAAQTPQTPQTPPANGSTPKRPPKTPKTKNRLFRFFM
ncbi:hypothetical protein AOQ84DRAFT_375486 [Glonium stellatum]|uniref:DH domain-containing protein n=1 Tax=Glonium stellatum TaxID=574774 RepID=A0A8E2JU68_9PEZI|nr:hypothetical protein AOQ84DRAFT_375486 [Glonium stellatum]